jgi:hypothetical protein
MLIHASLTDIPCLTAWKGNGAMLTAIGLVQLKKKFIKIPISTLFSNFQKFIPGFQRNCISSLTIFSLFSKKNLILPLRVH